VRLSWLSSWSSINSLRGYLPRQPELAKLAGVSPQTVLNLEYGKGEQAQRRTIRKLAQALGVQPQELVKLEE
jgi:transcriptional regulator with XRE-family HTH domain